MIGLQVEHIPIEAVLDLGISAVDSAVPLMASQWKYHKCLHQLQNETRAVFYILKLFDDLFFLLYPGLPICLSLSNSGLSNCPLLFTSSFITSL